MNAPQTTSASYEVGYRKPPRHTQFHKGQSGNPGGRPRRLPAKRLDELALYEAYRPTVVMEDGHAMPMPVIQAVLRRQLESAAGGNVRAQRDILAMIRDIEQARSIAALFDDGDADDVVNVTDDADAIDGDDNDVDDTADADRDDAGGADDDEPARQQADGIDTYGERREAERGVLHPPLKGEGRTAEGSPGWGDGRATDDNDAEFAEPLSPPPGPLTRADLPPAEPRYSEGSATQQSDRSRQQPTSVGGGEVAREPTAPPAIGDQQPEDAPPAGRTPSLTPASESGQRRGVLPRRNSPGRSADVQPARPQPGRRRRGPAVNAGKIRGGRSGGSRRSPGRRNADPARPRLQAGTPARRPPLPNETKN